MVNKEVHEGIDAISIRMKGRAYNTLIQYKRELNFPMMKVGGIWVAYEEDVAKWEEHQINGVFFEDTDRVTQKNFKNKPKTQKKRSKKVASK
jgi:hypothetical protein